MLENAFQDITNLAYKRVKLTIHKSVHRTKLLRWVYEVCRDFKYTIYTYTAAVMIIDKYTERTGFELSEYQLIGITSLFLAAKIEEPRTRPVSEYSIVTDNTFTIQQIIAKELSILQALDYDLLIKLPQFFFNPEYFQEHFPAIGFDSKLEIMNCFIAARLEEKSFWKNVFVLYLESKRDLELSLTNKKIPGAVKFYIENNPKLGNSHVDILCSNKFN